MLYGKYLFCRDNHNHEGYRYGDQIDEIYSVTKLRLQHYAYFRLINELLLYLYIYNQYLLLQIILHF